MNKIILITIGLIAANFSFAQIKGVTETGEEVILYENGTWKYSNQNDLHEKEVQTNSKIFRKNNESTFLLKSNKLNVGIYINPKKWSFKRATDNPEAEYELQFKEGDLYGMVITEKVEIPLETLGIIALENGKKVAPDLKIVKKEYRIVNGIKVLLLQMNGTMKGIKISYYGYYFSNSNGTIQFIAFTSQKLIENFKSETEKLLNGIVEI